MPTKQFSLRIDADVFDALDRQAGESGETRTALAQQLLDEGLRMQKHRLIWFREEGVRRRPAIVGTRLDVWNVVETIRQNNNSVAEAAEYLEMPLQYIEACVAYYADYTDEIDAWTAAEQEYADRAYAAWLRGEQLFV